MRVPWTAKRTNLSILKEINPECSLEGQILKLRLQYFGHLMRREDSLEKTLMLGKCEDKRRRGCQRMRWLVSVTEATNMNLTQLREAVEDRRLQYFGHLMRREDSLEKTLMLGKCEGKRRRGRPRTRWLDSVIEATNMNLTQLREAVEDRRAWRALVHGVTKSRARLND